jgi:putative sterol carrier protein
VVQHLSPEWVELHRSAGAALPERPGATARLQHVITGTPDGEVAYSVAIVDGKVVDATLGRDDDAADCTFLESYDDAVHLARGELDLHVGFMRGRIKMSGDMGRFMAVLDCTQSEPFQAALASIAAATET